MRVLKAYKANDSSSSSSVYISCILGYILIVGDISNEV